MPEREMPRETNEHDSLGGDLNTAQWRGTVNANVRFILQQIEVLFAEHKLTNDNLNNLKEKVTMLTAKTALLAAVGSFIGTIVSSVIIAAIIKLAIK